MLKNFLTILYAVILITYMTACAAPKPQEKVEEPDAEEEETTAEEETEETEKAAEDGEEATTEEASAPTQTDTAKTAPAAPEKKAEAEQPETAKPQ